MVEASSDQTPVHHPTLNCRLVGKSSQNVIEYRGLKYASIPGRWKESTLLDSLPTDPSQNDIHDATKFGPSCPQNRAAQAWDLTLVGDAVLPCEQGQGKEEVMNEFECLHLNVVVPRQSQESVKIGKQKSGELPVFVWVHGGGLSMGSNSWPQYQLANFVSHSLSIGKPVIGVGINYRVGVLGFLASKEINVEGNLGFKDIANAFRWIRKHIVGFGGDQNDITAAGESAGSIALSTLLCSEERELWDRVVLMSGDVTLRKPRSRAWEQELYCDQVKLLKLEGMGREERVKMMKAMDAEEMCQKLPLAQHFTATIDGVWLKKDVTLDVLRDGANAVHKPSWCKEFVVGDTAHDVSPTGWIIPDGFGSCTIQLFCQQHHILTSHRQGTILKSRIVDNPNALSLLQTVCSTHLSPSSSSRLLSAYTLQTNSNLTKSEAYNQMLVLSSDLRFHHPPLIAHDGWLAAISTTSSHQRASRYAIHISNPISGAFKGLASHELDVAYLLLNFQAHLPEKHQVLAKSMAEVFINYTYGSGFGSRPGDVTVFSDDGVKSMSEETYDREWRSGRGVGAG